MLPDQAMRIVVLDGDGRHALETLFGIQQVEAGVAAFVDPKALHLTTSLE